MHLLTRLYGMRSLYNTTNSNSVTGLACKFATCRLAILSIFQPCEYVFFLLHSTEGSAPMYTIVTRIIQKTEGTVVEPKQCGVPKVFLRVKPGGHGLTYLDPTSRPKLLLQHQQ